MDSKKVLVYDIYDLEVDYSDLEVRALSLSKEDVENIVSRLKALPYQKVLLISTPRGCNSPMQRIKNSFRYLDGALTLAEFKEPKKPEKPPDPKLNWTKLNKGRWK